MPESMEERSVVVEIPKLSADANHRLTSEVRDVVGRTTVSVPADRPYISRGDSAKLRFDQRVTPALTMTVGTIAVAVGVGVIIATTGNSWWLTALAVVVLLVVLAGVVTTIIGLASTTEAVDPSLAALLSEQGVRDPDVLFTALVDEFTLGLAEGGTRQTAVEDDAGKAAAEQRESVTPSGGPSEAVGPGSD